MPPEKKHALDQMRTAPVGSSIISASHGSEGLGRYWLPISVLLLGVALSIGAFFLVRARDRAERLAALDKQAAQVAAAVQVGFDAPLEVLRSLPALFEATGDVSRAEFREFVRRPMARHPGIYALEWLPRVPAGERDALENAARADGLSRFQFTERAGAEIVRAAERGEYLPIYFMEPPNDIALGLDVASDPERRGPPARAAETGATVATLRFQLVEDPPGVFSVAVYEPVFRHDLAIRTPGARRTELRGFAVAVFRIRPVVERSLHGVDAAGLDLVLLDPSAPPDNQLLFESAPGVFGPPVAAGARQWSTALPFADRLWSLGFTARVDTAAMQARSFGVLAAGLLLSILAGLGFAGLEAIFRLRRQVQVALKLGQYTLVEKLGQGGMGTVYKAEHAMLRRPTAVKLLPFVDKSDQRLARFEREAQLTSRLAHPNTIAVYDYGSTPQGVFYYAMEYIEGITLEELVAADGRQPPARVVHLLEQVCGALAEAHAVGLIHRDVKPANVMLCVRGGIADFIKVLDFGLAKQVRPSDDAPALSLSGTLLGTPLYLSPEAVITPDSIDARSDLYSLGAVGYFLLVGKPVFEGRTLVEVCSRHIHATPVPPSERGVAVPAALEHLILRCLAKNRDERPASAEEILRALAACGDMGTWSGEDAQNWWRYRGLQVVEQARSARDKAMSRPRIQKTMAIDLRRRERGHGPPESPT